MKRSLGRLPERIVANAGCGSEENYEYLEGEGARAFVKYGMFHKEQKRSFKEDPMQPANWEYDEKSDEYTCASGRRLTFLKESR